MYKYKVKPTIMTHAESVFFKRIQAILGAEHFIFPQVHWSAIFAPELKRQWWQAAFRHINGKSVDFVVCDRQLKPLFAIELDDWSHKLPKRVVRDAELQRIASENHFPLVRIDGSKPTSDAELRAALLAAAVLSPLH